ncbi:MAG: sigma-54 dependent transcriptional regulator [Candidatus Wallbacteria bacterium]|nr:sigma-54 dependent transcriptional regulator [Candidatus Wallbacteria bacterium]
MPKILVIDDEQEMVDTLEIILRKKADVVKLTTAVDLEKQLALCHPDLVITDLKMEGPDGLEVLKIIRSTLRIPVIIMTAYATVETAIKALKDGAADYLIKPFSRQQLLDAIEKCLKTANPETAASYEEVKVKYGMDLIGVSSQMIQVFEKILKVAPTNSSVLITGESGVGKSLAAKSILDKSQRRTKPFVTVDMGSIPAALFESELFGHEKGSFTGATERKIGKIESADGGTLFLDEIGDLPLETQPKIMRLLQERVFERVGGVTPISIDVRIISATNRNLEELIERKIFRQDLYYRLNVFPIPIPPLRERRPDIMLHCEHFIRRFCEENNAGPKSLSQKAIDLLLSNGWPGNVRELYNVLERALILSDEIIMPEHLWLKAENGEIPSSLDDLEREHIRRVMSYTEGNKLKAAAILGIERSTLYRLIKKYQLE